MSLASGAALVGGATPAEANASCKLIEAFTSKEGKGLRKLSIATTRHGAFDVVFDKKKTPLRGAETCELAGPIDGFELRCSWGLGSDMRAAESLARAYQAKFAPCLSEGWTEPESLYQGQYGRIIREYNSSIDLDDKEVRIEIEVWNFSDRFDVDVEITRD